MGNLPPSAYPLLISVSRHRGVTSYLKDAPDFLTVLASTCAALTGNSQRFKRNWRRDSREPSFFLSCPSVDHELWLAVAEYAILRDGLISKPVNHPHFLRRTRRGLDVYGLSSVLKIPIVRFHLATHFNDGCRRESLSLAYHWDKMKPQDLAFERAFIYQPPSRKSPTHLDIKPPTKPCENSDSCEYRILHNGICFMWWFGGVRIRSRLGGSPFFETSQFCPLTASEQTRYFLQFESHSISSFLLRQSHHPLAADHQPIDGISANEQEDAVSNLPVMGEHKDRYNWSRLLPPNDLTIKSPIRKIHFGYFTVPYPSFNSLKSFITLKTDELWQSDYPPFPSANAYSFTHTQSPLSCFRNFECHFTFSSWLTLFITPQSAFHSHDPAH
ncbi:uncharacterized protein BDR25DRAFT_396146 [Lindgomyces ingoldianus]|uniref:Uncharacterized protein n=1 Tax=Lindgomyces ingoldianus TaxID=673940 RepID=A0ACB6QFZ0_9PLEO|nr:uncharacterized protein BDR25DRAFT_396146 [Lindgomyces ingoldianus]KAF2465415.1 hypothetical protein BDR25DRAFT_396146 [Lindgomyces ingoldianus]